MRILRSIAGFVKALPALGERRYWRTVGLMSANTYRDLPAVLRGLVAFDPVRGKHIANFEAAFATYHGGGYAYSFNAGRVALAAILEGLGIGAGDEVIIPGYTCVAVPNPVLFRGATPIYADICPDTFNIDVGDVLRKITPKTRAIVAQHTYGLPADMERILELAKAHGLKVIEDCTHALGARYRGTQVGKFGDAAFFSMEQTKVISTGIGGIAYTQDPELAKRLDGFQQQCEWPEPREVRQRTAYVASLFILQGPLSTLFGDLISYYLSRLGLLRAPVTTDDEMHCWLPSGFNMRLSNSLALVGLSQLRQLPDNIAHRRRIAACYDRMLPALGVAVPALPPGTEHVFLRYPIRLENKTDFRAVMAAREVGVGDWFSAPVHPREVRDEHAGYVRGSCPNAEEAVRHVANLPCHPRMSEADVCRVIRELQRYLNEKANNVQGKSASAIAQVS